MQIEMFNYPLIDSTYRENGKKCLLTKGQVPISFFAPIVCPLAINGPYTKAVNEAYKNYNFSKISFIHCLFFYFISLFRIQAQLEAGLTNAYLKKFAVFYKIKQNQDVIF